MAGVRLLYGIFGRLRRGRTGPRKAIVLDIRGGELEWKREPEPAGVKPWLVTRHWGPFPLRMERVYIRVNGEWFDNFRPSRSISSAALAKLSNGETWRVVNPTNVLMETIQIAGFVLLAGGMLALMYMLVTLIADRGG
jgi:hypothetical protein